jgi:hypothetical protein
MQLPFDEELNERIGQDKASRVLDNVLIQQDTDMDIYARMHLDNLHIIGGKSIVLLNAEARFASGANITGLPFRVSRSDCVDRIAFYQFHAGMMI